MFVFFTNIKQRIEIKVYFYKKRSKYDKKTRKIHLRRIQKEISKVFFKIYRISYIYNRRAKAKKLLNRQKYAKKTSFLAVKSQNSKKPLAKAG